MSESLPARHSRNVENERITSDKKKVSALVRASIERTRSERITRSTWIADGRNERPIQ